jgi:hypothetical protein
MNLCFTVGAGVMREALLVIGVGASNAKPHSVENVTFCSQSVMITFDAKPVRLVAQMVVSTAVYCVEQLLVPSMIVV